MEYVEGPTLDEWLASDPPLADRLDVVAQVADALDTVHAAGIYHRDIKPSNILLTHQEDGALQATLSDFGLGAAEDQELLKSIYVSRVEGVAGTWDYIAPELRKGGSTSAASDIYSLGLTLFQVVTGDLKAQVGLNWEEHVESQVLRSDLAKCLAQEPADRWGRAKDLATALRSHDEREDLLRLEREGEKRRLRARRRRMIAVTVVPPVAACIAFLHWLWMRRNGGAVRRAAGGPRRDCPAACARLRRCPTDCRADAHLGRESDQPGVAGRILPGPSRR